MGGGASADVAQKIEQHPPDWWADQQAGAPWRSYGYYHSEQERTIAVAGASPSAAVATIESARPTPAPQVVALNRAEEARLPAPKIEPVAPSEPVPVDHND
jgi:hypothetical protein